MCTWHTLWVCTPGILVVVTLNWHLSCSFCATHLHNCLHGVCVSVLVDVLWTLVISPVLIQSWYSLRWSVGNGVQCGHLVSNHKQQPIALLGPAMYCTHITVLWSLPKFPCKEKHPGRMPTTATMWYHKLGCHLHYNEHVWTPNTILLVIN